ncbi:hypothetical protein [Thermococcus gorgonarius]|uniref:hypothetical protein n=1 Tax=Thermococcus gorgonarius TaxID=71997 RepID=UPI001E372794|nr:hypothetical protein [Thermococcus gorgonarius]
MSDWESYADLLVYGALSELITGNRSGALELYSRLLGMWDGNGFRDRAFDGTYQTYKCALFVYLYRALGKPKEGRNVYSSCLNVISSMQAENGGIITGYKVEGERIISVGDTNTETTPSLSWPSTLTILRELESLHDNAKIRGQGEGLSRPGEAFERNYLGLRAKKVSGFCGRFLD